MIPSRLRFVNADVRPLLATGGIGVYNCRILFEMTVWIVNPFDNLPVEGYRPQRYWLMARAFARAGHAVTYWTSDFSHARKAPRRFKDRPMARPSGGAMSVDGFRLVLVPTRPYPYNICLRRVLSHRAFARAWKRMAVESGERPDVTIASLPPLSSCAAALDLCRNTGARFVADVQDAWPETFYRLAPRWLFAPLKAMAGRIYRSADAVTAVAQRYIDLARSYGAAAPTHLCHLGIEIEKQAARPAAPSKTFNLFYLGAMGKSYDLETVIDAVKEMEDVELDLAGTGPKEMALRRRAADCPRIHFRGYLEKDATASIFRRAHAGVIPMFPDSCVGVPNKLADYAAAGLRVVNSLPGETAQILDKFGAGVSYEAGNMVSFIRAVRKLRRQDHAVPDGFRLLFDAERLYGGFVDFIEKKVSVK